MASSLGQAPRLPPLLVFGYGNPSRGDDALGPDLVDALQPRVESGQWRHLELLTDFQLQVEHILDMEPRELILFVDADMKCLVPFRFSEILPRRDRSYTSHAMTPEALLYTYREVLQHPPPPSFMLSIAGNSFGLGECLTPEAAENFDRAMAFIERLCSGVNVAAWRGLCVDDSQNPVAKRS